MPLITLGLSEIQVGAAAATGVMPADGELTKIGKTYQDTCKMAQATSDVTEHFEEGKAAPEVRKKKRKMPVLTFSIMDPDADLLANYVGGEKEAVTGRWGYNGDEVVAAKAVRVMSEQGLYVDIPNGDIEAVINADYSAKGIFLVDFTVTPLAVATGKKAFQAYPKPA